jgi:hypothetical protein
MFGWVFSLRVPYLHNPQYCVINKRRKHEIANFAVVKHLFIIFIVVKVVSYLENFGKLAPIKRRPAPACEGGQSWCFVCHGHISRHFQAAGCLSNKWRRTGNQYCQYFYICIRCVHLSLNIHIDSVLAYL